MKKISAVFVFFLTISGLLWAQSEEPIAVETEVSSLSALSNGTTQAAGTFRQEGVASWYGAEFAGRATASGEIFDPAHLTAAHADLPFGTYLIVTNTENGKKIAVRVNDRGPFVRSRILDVSRAAAERLDMLTAGTAKVIIESTTRESAQSLIREIGVPATTMGAASRTTAPSSSSGTAATASSSPEAAMSRTTAPSSSSGTAVAPSLPEAAASRTTAPSSSSGTAATTPSLPEAAASRTNTADTPVMAPTAPRTPVQSGTVPAQIPSASVSRVTGQVENIPEIRRPSDSGYIVVDEQVPPRTTPPVVVPAPSAPIAARTTPATTAATPAPSASTAARTVSATTAAPPATSAPTADSSASPLATAPQTVTPAVTPVSTEAQPAPDQTNPAASVPVTGPQSVSEKLEFTGSPIVQGKRYRVQVGSFTELKNASEVFLKLSDADLNPSYERYEDKYYRVVITNVKAEDADYLSRKLAEIGITEALAREDAER